MARQPPIDWRGAQVLERAQSAQTRAINVIMSRCVKHAMQHHTWTYRTGTLHGSLRIIDYAQITPEGAAGLWGSTDVNYARILEQGGERGDGHYQRPFPYLRPAADVHYPDLAAILVREWDRAGKPAAPKAPR